MRVESKNRPVWMGYVLLLVLSLNSPLSTLNCEAANKNVGTSGAAFLKIAPGARPVAMGEAFTALADDVNTVAYNPAGLALVTGTEFTAQHAQWFQEMGYEFAAVATPSRWGTFGAHTASLAVDKIERRLADTDDSDGQFDARDAVYALSYGRAFGENWSVGLGAGYIRQTLYTKSATAYEGNFGALWRTPHKPLRVGLAVKHLGTQPKFDKTGDPLPLTYNLGAGYRVLYDRLRLGADVRFPRDNGMKYAAGLEWAQPLPWNLTGSLRGGYNTANTDSTDGLDGLAVGVGLAWYGVGFDAAWVPYGVLGQTFRYSLLVKF